VLVLVCCVGWNCSCSSDADAVSGAQTVDAATADADAAAAPDAAKQEPPATPAAGSGNGNADAAFVLPDNGGFETARAVEVGADTMQRVVNASQVDYYSFEAKAGSFYVLSTDKSGFSPDNVITVLDPERNAIAENDSGSLYPNDHVDTRVIVRPEHAGTYYVIVEDRVLPGADAEGHFIPPLFYRLSLREITAGTEGYALETAGDEQPALALALEPRTQTHYITLLGTLSDRDDTDTFTLQGLLDYALIGQLHKAGAQGDGSTAEAATVRVIADSDGHLLARCALTTGQSNIHPPVDDATYRIQVSAGDKDIGSNAFYAIDLVLLHDNPHERTELDNDSVMAAEPVMLSGGSNRRGLLLSRLPAKDIDHYRFDAQAGDLVAINCEGESGGSGVRGLTAEVLTPMMASVVKGRELSPKPLYIKPTALEQAGTYYLKLTSETPVAEAMDDSVEPWVRCAVLLGR
jgi:hypothetical protein